MEQARKISVKSQSFADLPELVLTKIFSYLPTIVDLIHAGRVCSQWHAVYKHESLWRHLTLSEIYLTPDLIDKFLQSLPSCTSYLKIVNNLKKRSIPTLNRKYGSVLKDKCPNLKTFIAENFVLLFYVPCTDFYIKCLPPNVSVISFRGSVLEPELFFINKLECNNITVVDLSFCMCIKKNQLSFFNQMVNLKELYLAGCLIENGSIMNLFTHHDKAVTLNLKVLDLEDTKVTDHCISWINEGAPFLEKLYLARTNVTFNCLEYLIEEPYWSREMNSSEFPFLTHICLKSTPVDFKLLYSLAKFKSMKYMDVVSNDIIKDNISNLNENLKAKFRFHDEIKSPHYCNHFTKTYAR